MLARSLVGLAALLAVFAAAPAAEAWIDTCGTNPVGPGTPPSPLHPFYVVQDTLAFWDASACGGAGGPVVGDWPCGPGVHAAPGTFCGGLYFQGQTANCFWMPIASTATVLAVGFDVDFDGNIFQTPDGAAALVPPGQGTTVVNPHGTPARLIAYPVGAAQSAGDLASVSCV